MSVVLIIPDRAAVELHDLIIDAALHDGRVSTPLPVSAELEAVVDQVRLATGHTLWLGEKVLMPRHGLPSQLCSEYPMEAVLEAAALGISRA